MMRSLLIGHPLYQIEQQNSSLAFAVRILQAPSRSSFNVELFYTMAENSLLGLAATRIDQGCAGGVMVLMSHARHYAERTCTS